MGEDDDERRAEHRRAVFDRAEGRGVDEVAGVAGDEQFAEPVAAENQFGRHAAVGAGDDRGPGRLMPGDGAALSARSMLQSSGWLTKCALPVFSAAIASSGESAVGAPSAANARVDALKPSARTPAAPNFKKCLRPIPLPPQLTHMARSPNCASPGRVDFTVDKTTAAPLTSPRGEADRSGQPKRPSSPGPGAAITPVRTTAFRPKAPKIRGRMGVQAAKPAVGPTARRFGGARPMAYGRHRHPQVPRADESRIESISKQNGQHLLFVEASAALARGEKVGLVGPNGAGKTTLFRMITGEDPPDEGQVSVDRGVTIGYFSQDVGEMAGRSVIFEVMDGAGPVSVVAAELAELETAMADPDQADAMDTIIERYGEAQHRFEELGGYALEGRAREVLAGLNFTEAMMDGDVGALSGGWKMRVALARILLMRPDAMLLDEPSNHLDLESLIWLEQFLKGYDGGLLMTSHDREFMNRIVNQDRRDRRRIADDLFRRLRILRATACRRAEAAAGPVRAPAGDAGEGDQVHRAVQGARLARRAGAEPGEKARQDRAGRAAPAPPGDSVRVPAGPAFRRGRRELEVGEQALWREGDL